MLKNLIRLFSLAVLGLLSLSHIQAQDLAVKGKVTDDSGEAIPGVSVTVKGTQRGTITNVDGTYSVNAASNATLVFSFLGYESQEAVVNNRATINISLKTDTKALEEVVVVGYGTQRKVETTGSIASVKSDELTQLPVTNVAQGLQARVSGVQINQNSGSPGGNISVRVRGTNSINGNSEPLYVVDGIQISNGGGINDVSPLSTINPNDIESVEVLKDASASAIYGARAANGVVLITTKRGKAGATRVSIDSYYGVQQAAKTLDVLNAAEFAQLENEVFKNNAYPNPASLGEGTDWQSLIFQKAPIQSHQLSINGGSEKTQLALSANYFNQDGIIVNSNFKRYSYRLNVDHKVSNRFKVGTSILGSIIVNNGIDAGSTTIGDAGVVTASVLGAAVGAPPTLQPYREDGSIFPFGEQGNGQYREVVNPLNYTAITRQRNIKRTLVNLFGEFEILPGFTYRASFNADVQNRLDDFYSPLSIINRADISDNSGSASKSNSNFLGLLHESILSYSHKFGEDHSLRFTGLFASQVENSNSNSISASGFPNDATRNEALQLALNRTVSSGRSKQRLDSYMGRINYGFRDKYFLDLTARVDGSSKFGANHKYGFFPAISAAWRIIEEDFIKDLRWMSDLKLRASYGITGNAGGLNPYQSLATVSSGGGYNLGNTYQTAISPTGIANPDLRWEKSAQTDIGLDIGLFNNRLSIVMDYYYKRTDDLLYVKTLPLSSGYGSITGNYASLENKGFEFAANATILNGPVRWSVSGNLTANRNKLLDLDGGTTQERFVTNYSLLSVGQPLGVFKTYVFDGINQTGDAIIPGYDGRVGGHKVKDLNNDGAINSEDQIITGNPNPKFIFGASTNLSYKNFDFSLFLSGSQGNDTYNVSRLSFENPLGQRNLLEGVVNRWTPTNPSNQYVSAFVAGRLPITDYAMEDGSYVRLKNITLGYTLPTIKGISRVRIYVSSNNLLTLTKYTGFDPEVNTYAGSNTAIGIDNLVYPQAKSFLGGIQLTF
ncbi:SusC/RagA family TonB-linked outer membrane protein [Salmonirosea aquatica]|uniref:SusC/RagA family TonB-linked outer membrane protein n=1 Tax=Salmonirosea aquatica TaxID=2654236 RepID=A0A7C9FXP0_9BACT|nr:SusC/RagA family TonB-linked outer membrane protein [Cytophagaceae bacterium SJW1-29]